ncbi:MAG: hypothetical protein ACI3ZQ_00780 [Candidatus Cryptobacteroides sp.]
MIFNIFEAEINRAIKIDELMQCDKNPFMKYNYKGVKTAKEKLDWNDVHKMVALDLESRTLLWNSRNCFFFFHVLCRNQSWSLDTITLVYCIKRWAIGKHTG